MGNALFHDSLPRDEWQARRIAYRARVGPWVEDRVRRTGRQQKHPVYDFLFEYYAFRPAHLMRWSPGAGVRLEGATPDDLDWPGAFVACDGGWVLPAAAFPESRRGFLRWAIDYLEAIAGREPQFGCFGLHEWAMVYRDDAVRHPQLPLRLSRAETDAVVDAAPLCCTHYDAFRFFTPAAVPLNRLPLTRRDTPLFDQPGCLHVTMDLYKWAFVVAPFSSSSVLADAFELALATRELDMRASPYDLSGLGFEPIRIETRAGREEYAAAQRELAHRSVPVRRQLLVEYRRLAEGHPLKG